MIGGWIGPLAANIIGVIGSICIVGAYAYNVYGKAVNPFVYNGTNLLGAVFLTISLLVHFNLASLLLEFVWMLIALGGLHKAWRARMENPL